jgi:hypothetical protein
MVFAPLGHLLKIAIDKQVTKRLYEALVRRE